MNADILWQVPDTLNRALEAARELKPSAVAEYKTHDAPALSLFWRSVSNYGAVLTLLSARYGEEALVLARSLFVDSLRLLQIAEAGDSHAGLSLGWLNTSYEEIRGLLLKARDIGLDSDPTEALNQVAEQQSKLQDYMRRHDVVKLEKFKSPEDTAKRYGRHRDYWVYFFSHEMVHGSDAAFAFRRERTGDGSFVIYGQSPDPQLLVEVGTFAGKSLLDSMKATSSLFQWNLPADFERLETELDALPDQFADDA